MDHPALGKRRVCNDHLCDLESDRGELLLHRGSSPRTDRGEPDCHRRATLSVGGWWDQEDLFGPQATYAALERLDTAGINSLVIGPWSHGQWFQPGGQSLGNLRFGSATADSFRLRIEAPWFAYWLKGRGDGRFPEAQLFDAGVNRWRTFDRWPPREARVRGSCRTRGSLATSG